MKQFIVGLAIGALTVFSIQHYFSHPEIPTSPSVNLIAAVTTASAENKTSPTLIAPSRLQEECTPVASKTIVEKTKPEIAEASKELESLRAQLQMHEQRREFAKLTEPGKAEALVASSRKEFEQEAIDTRWANQYQNQLSNFFRTDDQLNDVVPQSIECRSSRCRISIAVGSQQQFNQVASKLINTITSGKHSDITAKALVSPDMEEGVLQLYVARDQQVNLIP